MLARDIGFYDHETCLYLNSTDGLTWSTPDVAYEKLSTYIKESPAPAYLKRYGRLERPQLLIRHRKPTGLFTAAQGGKYSTSSAFIFRID